MTPSKEIINEAKSIYKIALLNLIFFNEPFKDKRILPIIIKIIPTYSPKDNLSPTRKKAQMGIKILPSPKNDTAIEVSSLCKPL